MIEHGPIPPENWYLQGAKHIQCPEPCCEMRRVEAVAVQVEDENELRDALTKPEVFWW